VNRKIVNTAIGRDVALALRQFGFPVSSTHLCQRVLYAESGARGLSVIEAQPHSKAAQEITRLAESVVLAPEREAAA
jgi:chromosome partitioning protein